MMRPTISRLRELFSYDAEYGVMISRATGESVGYEDHGYYRVNIDGKKYYVHIIAFCLMTGRWPVALIDHDNMVGTDNRWENLREATKSQNGANRGVSRRSATGIKGVSLCGITGRYRADIRVKGKRYNLGRFYTIDEAAAAYEAAAREFFGDFARTVQCSATRA